MTVIGLLLVIVPVAMGALIEVPRIVMNDGKKMPAMALGTYLGFDKDGVVKSRNKELRNTILEAIDVGYRHIDTAAIYGTDDEIGEGLRMKIDQGAVKRSDMFITTKLWNTQHRRDEVMSAMKESLNKTGLDYFDLYLMHWPIGLNADYSFSDVDFMETWRGMEDMLALGLTRSIGLSNFNEAQTKRVLEEGTVKPAALQIEISPQNIQNDLIAFCKYENITVMGYSPFGSLVKRFGFEFPGPKMDDPLLTSLGQKYNKTSAQIVLRWLVDRNVVPIAKTVNSKRLKENINIFDFQLQSHEIENISKFNSNTRYTLPSFWQNHIYYPFEKVANPIADPFKIYT